jgi:hypothetical protein
MAGINLFIRMGVYLLHFRVNEQSRATIMNISRRSAIVGLWLAVSIVVGGEAAQRRPNSQLHCAPAVMTEEQTLKLRMPLPHGGELGVRTPEGRFLFIAYRFDEQTNSIRPPVPSTDFMKMAALELSPRMTTGVDLARRSSAEPVFTKTGRYRFIVSYNLETEDDANLACDVQYMAIDSK